MSYTAEDAKWHLMQKVERVVGYVPDGMGDIMSILMGPDVFTEFSEYMRKHAEEKEKEKEEE